MSEPGRREVTHPEPDLIVAAEPQPGAEWAAYPPSAGGEELLPYVPPAGRPDRVSVVAPFNWGFLVPMLVALPNLLRMAMGGSVVDLVLAVVLLLFAVGSVVFAYHRRVTLRLDGEGLTVVPLRGEPVHLHWHELTAVRVDRHRGMLRWRPVDARATFPAPCRREDDGWWRLRLGGTAVDYPKVSALVAAYGPPRFTME